MSDVNVTFASQGARKALYFMYSFLFQKYTRACIALEKYNSNLKCCWFLRFIAALVFKTPCLLPSVKSGQTQFSNPVSSRVPCSSHRTHAKKHRGFVRLFFKLQKAVDVSYKTEIEVNKTFVCLTKYKSYFAFLFL